jgi:hypothetical protein
MATSKIGILDADMNLAVGFNLSGAIESPSHLSYSPNRPE